MSNQPLPPSRHPLEPDCASDDITLSLSAVKPGDRLSGRYEVREHLGSGGMGDVYAGLDELLCRDVAIKVLKLARVNPDMKKRLLREARAACAVDHPNMLRVTDMGYAGEAPFLVMDRLRGASLREVLRRTDGNRLAWRHALTLLLPAMDALHAAHEAGCVHRDIKPENLFLHHRRDGSEVLMVVDLGIVKFTDLAGRPAQRWTQTGVILGTVAYMSPEQASSGAIDRRADVYSMGATLYRLLTGQHVFPWQPGDIPLSILTRHIFEPPPRLPRAEFPAALAEAVDLALKKDPAQRHETMAKFAAALRACLAPRPRRAAPAGWAPHASLAAACALTVWSLQRTPSSPGPDAPAPASPASSVNSTHAPDPPGMGPAVSPAVASPAIARGPDDPPAPGSTDTTTPPVPAPLDTTTPSVPAPLDPPTDASAPAALDAAPTSDAPADRRTAGPAGDRGTHAPTPAAPRDPLTGAAADVRRCMHEHGDPDLRRLTVAVEVRDGGRVASVVLRGHSAGSFLAMCVRDRLLALRFAPGLRLTREYTYLAAEAV